MSVSVAPKPSIGMHSEPRLQCSMWYMCVFHVFEPLSPLCLATAEGVHLSCRFFCDIGSGSCHLDYKLRGFKESGNDELAPEGYVGPWMVKAWCTWGLGLEEIGKSVFPEACLLQKSNI